MRNILLTMIILIVGIQRTIFKSPGLLVELTPFIRYMLEVILACYVEFEERVGMMVKNGNRSNAYDIVRKYVEGKIGRFTGADVLSRCPKIGRSSVLASLKNLTEEGIILRQGSGRSTFYVRAN